MNARAHLWILNGKVPEACLDIDRWSRWFESARLTIFKDEFMGGDIVVSTFFRPISDPGDTAAPMLFETKVYGEEHLGEFLGRDMLVRDQLQARRYSAWQAAEAGHREVTARFRAMAESVHGQASTAIKGAR